MFVGYDDAGEQACPYADLDEYLCEYVDGEMDPAVRAAFEEILSRDPALAEHVECLRETRALLGAFRFGVDTPCGFQSRLRREISRELVAEQAPVLAPAAGPLRRAAALASVMALAVTAGFYLMDDGLSASVAHAPELADRAERLQPLYWSAAPVLVSADEPHYRLSYEGGELKLRHALHTHTAFEGAAAQNAALDALTVARLP